MIDSWPLVAGSITRTVVPWPGVLSIMEWLRRGERIEHFETTRIRKDGSTLEISLRLSPIRDARGRIVGAAGIGHEITDRRQAERERDELLTRERAAREQLGGVADGVIVQRASGAFIYANDAAVRMAGFDSTEAYLGSEPGELSRRLAVLDEDGQPVSRDQLPTRQLHEHQLRHASGATLLWQSIQSGMPLLVPVVTDKMLVDTAQGEEHLALLRALGLSSLLYAP